MKKLYSSKQMQEFIQGAKEGHEDCFNRVKQQYEALELNVPLKFVNEFKESRKNRMMILQQQKIVDAYTDMVIKDDASNNPRYMMSKLVSDQMKQGLVADILGSFESISGIEEGNVYQINNYGEKDSSRLNRLKLDIASDVGRVIKNDSMYLGFAITDMNSEILLSKGNRLLAYITFKQKEKDKSEMYFLDQSFLGDADVLSILRGSTSMNPIREKSSLVQPDEAFSGVIRDEFTLSLFNPKEYSSQVGVRELDVLKRKVEPIESVIGHIEARATMDEWIKRIEQTELENNPIQTSLFDIENVVSNKIRYLPESEVEFYKLKLAEAWDKRFNHEEDPELRKRLLKDAERKINKWFKSVKKD